MTTAKFSRTFPIFIPLSIPIFFFFFFFIIIENIPETYRSPLQNEKKKKKRIKRQNWFSKLDLTQHPLLPSLINANSRDEYYEWMTIERVKRLVS